MCKPVNSLQPLVNHNTYGADTPARAGMTGGRGEEVGVDSRVAVAGRSTLFSPVVNSWIWA